MPNNIQNYIDKAAKQGLTQEQITQNMLQAGWALSQILTELNLYFNKPQPILDQQPAVSQLNIKQGNSSQFINSLESNKTLEQEKIMPEEPAKSLSGVLKYFDPTFYANLLYGSQKVKPFLIAILLALIITIKPSIVFFSNWFPILKDAPSKVIAVVNENYPEELEITVKDGYASTNVTEPYYITIPKDTLDTFLPQKEKINGPKATVRLVTINTDAQASDFERYQTYALLTQKDFIYYDDGQIKTISLKEIKDVTISKQWIIDKINEINKNNRIGRILSILLYTFPLILFIGSYLTLLSSFFMLSFLLRLLTAINQIPVTFGKMFALTAAVETIPVILLTVFGWLPFVSTVIASLSSLSTVLLLAIAYMGITTYKNTYANNN